MPKTRSDLLFSFPQRGFDRSFFRLDVPSRKGYLSYRVVTSNNDQGAVFLSGNVMEKNDRGAIWEGREGGGDVEGNGTDLRVLVAARSSRMSLVTCGIG